MTTLVLVNLLLFLAAAAAFAAVTWAVHRWLEDEADEAGPGPKPPDAGPPAPLPGGPSLRLVAAARGDLARSA